MHIIVALALLLAGAIALVKGADWFTDGAGDVARVTGVSALLIGIILAGIEPEEMLTAAIASGRGEAGLAVGNIIGTNITILSLALGLAAILAPIHLTSGVRTQAIIATLASFPPVILLFMGTVSRLAGVLLLLAFVVYTLVLVRLDRQALQRHEALEALETGKDAADLPRTYTPQERQAYIWRKGRLALLGLVAMAAGGPAIVEGALRFATIVGLRQSAVGLTIVSLGTGAEMVALAFIASRRHQVDLLIGGIIGSFAYNLLVTLGLAALIHPLPIDPHITQLALPIMIVLHIFLLLLIWLGRIPRWVGVALLAAYLTYLIVVILR